MSSWPELEKFLFGFLGAILGGSFIAWISGYYSEKGKRELLREEWPKLLEEARQKSYEEEAGKRLATKEDVGNVVDQVRMVTKETETIKAQVSSGVWQQQWLLAQKRDLYGSLLEKLDAIYDTWEGKDHVTTSPLNFVEADQAFRVLNEKLADAERAFRRSATLALIFLNVDATCALEKYVNYEDTRMGPNLGVRQRAIGDCKRGLIEAARKDLGVHVPT